MPILQQLGGDCSFEAFRSENQHVQVIRIETQWSVASETVRHAFGQDVIFVGKWQSKINPNLIFIEVSAMWTLSIDSSNILLVFFQVLLLQVFFLQGGGRY